MLGMSYQQVQKYEKGIDRIAVSRLLDVAKALGVPFDYYFSGIEGHELSATNSEAAAEEMAIVNFAATREGAKLILAFSRIKDHALRKRVQDLVTAMAAQSEDE
jgi:transcriptional regulator with XRE-family HTH domain